MSTTLSDADRIARGLPPKPWEQTYTHPVHGEITFKATLPTAMDMAEHSVAMDNLLGNLRGEARPATMLLCAAIAGLQVPEDGQAGQGLLVTLPVVRQEEVETEGGASTKFVRHFYDPAAESNVSFLTDVWMDYSIWRASLLQGVDAVKGSSGETDGSGSSSESAAPTASPSTIPA